MNIVEDYLGTFVEQVIPPNAIPEQVNDMKMAFITGAISALYALREEASEKAIEAVESGKVDSEGRLEVDLDLMNITEAEIKSMLETLSGMGYTVSAPTH